MLANINPLRYTGSLAGLVTVLGSVAALSGCGTELEDPAQAGPDPMATAGTATVPMSTAGAGGTGSGAGPSTAGTTSAGGTVSSGGTGTTGGTAPTAECNTIQPGRAPLRRLTINEFNNVVRDLLGDTTNPGNELPSEILGKGFGNDADLQSVSDLLAEKYYAVSEAVAARATESKAALGRLHACASNVTPPNEEACVRSIVNAVLPRAFRRSVSEAEVEDFVELYRSTRALASTVTFESGVAAVLTALLQSPEFLYRPEFGVEIPGNPQVRALTGSELATRLSFLFWQTLPDEELMRAGMNGELATPEGILTQARRLLADPRARATVAFFFDNLLPVNDLAGLTRDEALFPMFSPAVGAAMRQEVHRLLEYEIFENTSAAPGSSYGAGSWPAILTAPYTFVNQALFDYYGAETFAPGTSVTGSELQKVQLNTSQRLGLLTLGGMMAGTTTTNVTNPVLRGGFIVKHLMCREIPLPNFAVAPPEPYTGKTARERYSKHSAEPGCAGCHQFMDPMGLALENYDAVGRFRATERAVIDGVTYDTPIDASGSVPGVEGTANGPVELVRLLASSEEVQNCFAKNWMQFAYGRMLDQRDECTRRTVQEHFKQANYDVKELLLALTQSDTFRYLPAE